MNYIVCAHMCGALTRLGANLTHWPQRALHTWTACFALKQLHPIKFKEIREEMCRFSKETATPSGHISVCRAKVQFSLGIRTHPLLNLSANYGGLREQSIFFCIYLNMNYLDNYNNFIVLRVTLLLMYLWVNPKSSHMNTVLRVGKPKNLHCTLLELDL